MQRTAFQSPFIDRLCRGLVAFSCWSTLLASMALLQGCDCSATDSDDSGGSGYLDQGGPADGSGAEFTGTLKDGPSKKLDILWHDILASNDLWMPDKTTGTGLTVSTLAGNGKKGYTNGAAKGAQFNFPTGVAVDKNGSVYVADQNNNRIRVVFNGKVDLVAGNGPKGHKDGAAAGALFQDPMDVAVDSAGRVYVADELNHRIRAIYKGQVSTLAGDGYPGSKDGAATSARFSSPVSVAVDSKGDVYVADQNNHSIRLISGGKVSTLAGTGKSGFKNGAAASSQFDTPSGIAVDSSGKVYVADQNNERIRLISAGQVTTLAGSGTMGQLDGGAATAQFDSPIAVAVDNKGKVYVADQNNHCIRVIEKGQVKTLAGDGYTGFQDGPVATARFNFPTGVAVGPAGKVYVADQVNARIRVISW